MHALTTGARSLAGFRFLLGVGEAGNWPAGVMVATEWFPARERALACGIFNSSAAIGAIIAASLVSWLALRYGWKATFVVIGLTFDPKKSEGRSRQLPEQEETNENMMKPEIDTQWVNHSHPRKVGSHSEANIA